MRNVKLQHSFFQLTEAYQGLLKIAFGPEDDARREFDRWGDSLLAEDLEVSIHRLLPLIARALGELGLPDDDPVLVRCQKVARVYWLKSKLLAQRIAPTVARLEEAGIPVMLIKGSAVVWHANGDVRARPMDDIDLLVHHEHVHEALALFQEAGFVPDAGALTSADITDVVVHRHALGLTGKDGAQVDVHWHPISCARTKQVADHFWAKSVPAMLATVPCRASSREDSFIHCVAHAFGNRPFVQMRWAADMAMLLTTSPDPLRWDDIDELAALCRVRPAVAQALTSLHQTLSFLPMEPGSRGIGHIPWLESLVARRRLDRKGRRRLANRRESFLDAWNEYISGSDEAASQNTSQQLRSFLAQYWALSSENDVGRHAVLVALGRPWFLRRRSVREMRHESDKGLDLLGRRLSFCLGGDGRTYLSRGWSNVEMHGTWSIASETTLSLKLPANGPFKLLVTLTPFRTAHHNRVVIEMSLNGRQRTTWVFRGSAWQTEEREVVVRAGVVVPEGDDEIRFIVSRPMSPSNAYLEPGTRPLGFSLAALDIEPYSVQESGEITP